MALYDGNGKITIDEIAAQKDINNLKQAVEFLQTTLDLINQIYGMALEFDSESNKAIVQACNDLKLTISNLMQSTTETSYYIAKTVKKYQMIDEQLKLQIQSEI